MQIQLKHWLCFYFGFGLLSLFLYVDYQKINASLLTVHYLDVGQGNASLILTPENQKILIDTGPPGSLNQKLKPYFSFFDKKIDLLILTHADLDHLGCIFEVLQSFSVQALVLPQDLQNKPAFNSLLDFVRKQNLSLYFLQNNTDLQIGSAVFLDMLAPLANTSAQTQNSLSNASLVFKIIYGKNTFLFSGDAGEKQEKTLVLSSQNLHADIYQVGHHGSKTSSSQIFLQAIQPYFAIISAGKNNSYGHPHIETLDRLKAFQSVIYTTFQDGDRHFSSDGNLLREI